MVLGLATFVLLWAAGGLALLLLRSAGQELSERWSKPLQGNWSQILAADVDGCTVYCPEGRPDRLFRYSADGELVWSRNILVDSFRTPVQRIGEVTYVITAAGELTAISESGDELWTCRPEFSRYRELLEPLPGGEPMVFLKAGILLYGVDAEGQPCWVANTQQMYDPFGLPSLISFNGEYSYFRNDFFTGSVYTISGEQLPLPQPAAAPEVRTVGGRQTYVGGQKLDLRSVLPEGGLLYAHDNKLVLVDAGGERSTELEKGNTQLAYTSSPNQVAASADLFLYPTSDGVLHALDRELMEVWNYRLVDCNLVDAQYSGDAFVLLNQASDNLVRSLEFFSLVFPRLASILPFYSLAPGQLMPQMQGGDQFELAVIRDGRKTGQYEIVSSQGFNIYSAMKCAGGQIYLIGADGELRCLVPGGGDD